MNLTVFGSTGGTGQQLIHAALTAGHTVTAAAREPSRIAISHERLRTLGCDVRELGACDDAVAGADAVASALGSAQGRTPTTVYSAGVANILGAMERAGVRRFVGISATPVTPPDQVGALERLVVFPLLRRFFGEGYADMARMEQVLRASTADWTVVRPPQLTDRAATGSYRTAINSHLRGALRISRADLAAAILDLIDDPRTIRAAVAVAH